MCVCVRVCVYVLNDRSQLTPGEPPIPEATGFCEQEAVRQSVDYTNTHTDFTQTLRQLQVKSNRYVGLSHGAAPDAVLLPVP